MKGLQPGKAGRTLAIEAKADSILAFESFVEGLAFLSIRERDRIKLAGGEIIDNIVRHSSPVEMRRIRCRVSRLEASVLLGFYFRSPSFASFAGDVGLWSAPAEPLFDPKHRRWRGIGLLMCRNLASRIVLRPGERMDRIFLEFATE